MSAIHTLFGSEDFREIADLSVVRIKHQNSFLYLKECRTPRFTSSTNNCSVLDMSSAHRLRDLIISQIAATGEVNTVAGEAVQLIERTANDTMASLYEKVIEMVESVRIADLLPICHEKFKQIAKEPLAARKMLITSFREALVS